MSGYKVRILDGNCLEKTDHRLEVLRKIAAGALPGKSLVVLDPELRLAINVFACEDGHAQERSLFNEVLKTVKQGELWIADRNMCTASFLLGLHRSGANFVIREHKSMPWKPITSLQSVGNVEAGELFEQTVSLSNAGESLLVRRVVLKLNKPTRNSDNEIAIFTMLPTTTVTAAVVTQLYLQRRSVENLFQTVTENYECQIQTLGYPKAALFSFCLALVAYNILATVRGVLASVHGVGKIDAGLSDYYMVNDIQGTYKGMVIAIAPEHWSVFVDFELEQFACVLQDLASRVRLKSFLKHTRASKKKKDPPKYDPKHPHVSTAKLLSQIKKSP